MSAVEKLDFTNGLLFIKGNPNFLASYDWLAAASCVAAAFALITLNSIPTVDNINPEKITLPTEKEKATHRLLYRITYGCLALAVATSAYSFVTTYRLGCTKIN